MAGEIALRYALGGMRRAIWTARPSFKLQLLTGDRQLVAVTPGPARTVRQGLQTRLFLAVKNLVAGLARDSKLPTQRRHLLAL